MLVTECFITRPNTNKTLGIVVHWVIINVHNKQGFKNNPLLSLSMQRQLFSVAQTCIQGRILYGFLFTFFDNLMFPLLSTNLTLSICRKMVIIKVSAVVSRISKALPEQGVTSERRPNLNYDPNRSSVTYQKTEGSSAGTWVNRRITNCFNQSVQ